MISAGFHPSDDLLVGFALDELEAAQRDAVDAHLDECDRCQRDYAATTDTLALLALAAPPVEPPAHLRARVLEVPRESPRRREMRSRRWTWTWPRVAVPALLVAAAVAVALYLPQMTSPGSRTVQFSNAAGAVQVSGDSARLASWTLGPAPSGHAYEVWVMRPGTAPRSVGVMADVTPMSIADVRAGDQIGVTIEPAAGSPGPTTAPVAIAQIT